MRYYLCGISDMGDTRDNNEDFFLINHSVTTNSSTECTLHSPFLTGVCDGVSSSNFGEIAADMTLCELARISYSSSVDLFREIILIDKKLKRYGRRNPEATNMQTTLCCIGIDENDILMCANIGDSRMYIFAGGTIRQVTTDQSLMQYLCSAGRITTAEAESHEKSSAIFPVLGNNDFSANPDIFSLNCKMDFGDVIIICTDGFSDCLTDEEIEIGLSLELTLKERLDTLIELALERGSTDNITAVAICRSLD